MHYSEVNFDGLVSPLHNYAGLSAGNIASAVSAKNASNPKAAALQGLDKMEWLMEQGLQQAFIPPHRRPAWNVLENLGYKEGTQLEDIPFHLLASCTSASSMWTANAATVCPSLDAADEKLHLLTANLASNFHRSIEPPTTAHYLRSILPDASHHVPLPATPAFFDEGAANHTRLSRKHSEAGVHLFVYGKNSLDHSAPAPQKFPARQTLEASIATARVLNIPENKCVFAQQSPVAIDAGVFHNDVISTGNESVFLYHEDTFLDTETTINALITKLPQLQAILVPRAEVSLTDAVSSYLFNSQIITLPDASMLLLAPEECKKNASVYQFIENKIILGENPIGKVVYMDLKQSMANGGGPACLRLRMVMSELERKQIPAPFWINQNNLGILRKWINSHYRDKLRPTDLLDPKLHQNAKRAFDELQQHLQIKI